MVLVVLRLWLIRGTVLCLLLLLVERRVWALSSTSITKRNKKVSLSHQSRQLVQELQTKCFSPIDVLDRVGRHVTPLVDPSGELARLVLVRLCKQLISLDNNNNSNNNISSGQWWAKDLSSAAGACEVLDSVVNSLLVSISSSSSLSSFQKDQVENLVESTKALAVSSRLVPEFSSDTLQLFWHQQAVSIVPKLEEHQLSGAYWALETMRYTNMKHGMEKNQASNVVPEAIQRAYMELNLPFHIYPGMLSHIPSLSLESMCQEVEFQVDDIRTVSNKVVKERRGTSWQGDEAVAPFEYGGKTMPTKPWSPLVLQVRNVLAQDSNSGESGRGGIGQYYDCCLLNHYLDGGSGMRYHIDPDQGTLWDYDTAVVSVGATRCIAFRKLPAPAAKGDASKQDDAPHNFVVLHGDVMHMYGPCQDEYQHCVKKAESRDDDTARVSLVFKRSWGLHHE